jgi:hypothetical protein
MDSREDQDRSDRLRLVNYNMEYHLELLTRADKLRCSDFHNKSQEAIDLAMFTRFFNGALNWRERFSYLKLMADFLENKLELNHFCEKIFEKSISISEKLDSLESELTIIRPHLKSFFFNQKIEEIIDFSEYYCYNPELYNQYDREEFCQSVRKNYIELKKLVNTDNIL